MYENRRQVKCNQYRSDDFKLLQFIVICDGRFLNYNL